MKKTIIFITIIIFIIFILPSGVFAQDSLSLSIYPPLLEAMIKPGKTITQLYKIGNQGEKEIEVVTQLVPFKPSGVQGNITLVFNKAGFDKAINWFSWQNADKKLNLPFKLKAGKTEELVLKIRVPEKAQEKDYYYSLLVKANPQILSKGQTRTTARPIIGGNILLTVSRTGQIPRDLNISDFSLKKKGYFVNIIDSFDNISFGGLVKNKSVHLAKIDGEIIIAGKQGQVSQKLKLLPVNILAASEREIVCLDTSGCTLAKRLFFGQYKATLAVDSRAGKTEKSFYFLVLPLRATASLVVFSLLLLFFARLLKWSSEIHFAPKKSAD